MENLFDIPDEQWELDKKVRKLRKKIADKALELNIVPEHDDTGHYYRFGDKKYFSVTGWLQILKDPSLANWKMNEALGYMREQIMLSIDPWNNPESLDKLILDAKQVPVDKFQNAGSTGTAVHNWREAIFKYWIENGSIVYSDNIDYPPEQLSAQRAIKKFVTEHDYRPVACELYVADHKLKTGGQVDDIGFVDGELALVDLKTSNIGDKESYFAQVALYLYMFKKNYKIHPKKLYILHASKTDGTYKLIPIRLKFKTEEGEFDLIKWARMVVDVSHGLEIIKQMKKKQVNYL